jgi:hypothetical protein
MYPEAARRLGARAWEALRSGATTVVDRLLGRRHPEVKVNVCARNVRRQCLKKAKVKKGVGV